MKSLTNTQLNRIKIKDLMARIQEAINPEGMGIYRLEILNRMGNNALRQATDEDLENIEKLYIKTKLEIEYFHSQNKKRIKINGKSKIVPIDYEYGSKND